MTTPIAEDWRNWLTKQPIAHRGLHDGNISVMENSLAAAEAAIARQFAIECDVQPSADGQAIVFHDVELERLTQGQGKIMNRTASELAALPYIHGPDHPVSLEEFINCIAGRTPLIVEIKSDFSGDVRLARRVAEIVAGSSSPVALKSFDPTIMSFLRKNRAALRINHVPLGMVAEANYTDGEWAHLSRALRSSLTHFLHWDDTRPDFLSWHIGDLPHSTPHLLRRALGLPVMTWTVRTEEQRALAMQWADQIVFEETRGLHIAQVRPL